MVNLDYKLNKYQSLLNNINDINKKMVYLRKINSYKNKLNLSHNLSQNILNQFGGDQQIDEIGLEEGIKQQLKTLIDSIGKLEPPKLREAYNTLVAENKGILSLLQEIDANVKYLLSTLGQNEITIERNNGKIQELTTQIQTLTGKTTEVEKVNSELQRLNEVNLKLEEANRGLRTELERAREDLNSKKDFISDKQCNEKITKIVKIINSKINEKITGVTSKEKDIETITLPSPIRQILETMLGNLKQVKPGEFAVRSVPSEDENRGNKLASDARSLVKRIKQRREDEKIRARIEEEEDQQKAIQMKKEEEEERKRREALEQQRATENAEIEEARKRRLKEREESERSEKC